MGFLVLSRRLNERILIGDDVEILIADIRQDKSGELIVDIGLTGPKHVKFLRKETHLQEMKNKNGFNTRNKSGQKYKRN